MAPTHPIIYYGTTLFGSDNVPPFKDPEVVSPFLDIVSSCGINQIDTAARYPPDNHGGSERMLGSVKAAEKGFTINTKVLFPGNNSDGTLTKEAVRKSVANSLKVLGVEKIGILYAHVYDKATPLEEQAEAFSEQVEKGYCERYGLSNYPLSVVKEFVAICEAKNLIKPQVFQGQYNLICRDPEAELIPFLHANNIVFNAYSPLGGGFLSGKLTTGQAEGTRLDTTKSYGDHFRQWYDRPEFHDAIKRLLAHIEPLGIKATEAALRWLAYHSLLKEQDGIILGATKEYQIRQNAEDIAKGPLPQDVVDLIASIWDTIASISSGTFELDVSKLPTKDAR